jgi:hypothetical protein
MHRPHGAVDRWQGLAGSTQNQIARVTAARRDAQRLPYR